MGGRIDLEEKTLAEQIDWITTIFSDVLDIKEVNSNDNFFELGGDSYDAIRVMSRLGSELHIVAIFENPTAEKLARYILEYATTKREARLIPLHEESSADGTIAVIGVPFGGGDPTAYRDVFRGNENVQVFGVDFGDLEVKNSTEFSSMIKTLLIEIEKINVDQLIVYGHCAGSATAACIAKAITNKVSSLSLVVAASQPIDNPDASVRQAEITSDYDWSEYLRSLGAFNGLSDEDVEGMLSKGRRDHQIASEAYRELINNQWREIPSLVILGDEDPATPSSSSAVNKWRDFIDVSETATISGGGHYFIRTHTEEVSNIVLKFALQNKKE
ncbi:Surfactin synthase thioesterase subunit [Halobacillus karajensis]|uniref:phosphopantetheine-binding protein n=1 Tax=Halobacillus karajensis TaxID=195088 RepID=UPI0008A78DB7|nr:alpha/beta hydrolase [Halobacillus karajensis]SEH77056.1 Surfactin synthase thioesterase subunit [Halobacillus karajensis]